MPCYDAPPANTRGDIAGIRLHSAQPTLCFQAWLGTNGSALVLRTDFNENSQILVTGAFHTHPHHQNSFNTFLKISGNSNSWSAESK